MPHLIWPDPTHIIWGLKFLDSNDAQGFDKTTQSVAQILNGNTSRKSSATFSETILKNRSGTQAIQVEAKQQRFLKSSN